MIRVETWEIYIENNDIKEIKYLLEHNLININIPEKYNGWTPLIMSSYLNRIKIVELLLKHPDINIFLKNVWNKTALDYAKYFNYKEIKTLLINYNRKEKLKLLK
jgi:ankyrin repeat protein